MIESVGGTQTDAAGHSRSSSRLCEGIALVCPHLGVGGHQARWF
jgi:hypothetical protein